ncbi:hypothetical protein CH373_04885 [Leptospira perolatii]|uniref:Anti-sigma factor antagonist n=1 Tax=Leptospira perolatii TaxID=2023191 RepID=A0A2M9ZQ93_9LEPT|nr:STAS domain-containing protein [Leptospira perolatii]PJZ70412.1 hypothetical protein CH360_05305 [Leptospira perolatii]PJZ74248.1 hypothetical protein CH373_04885 [Leptospira perolatii]
MEIKSEISGTSKCIGIEGEINLYNVSDLRNSLYPMIEAEKVCAGIILNMESVPYIDSSGVGFLAQLQRKVKNHKMNFQLTKLKPDVLTILRLASLEKHFDIV